jgi:hypothetical protein
VTTLRRPISDLMQPAPRRVVGPMPVCVERVIEWQERRLCRDAPEALELLARHIKRDMARQLADFILENCCPIDVKDAMRRDDVVRIELTLDDRGAYERMLPEARRDGIREGTKAGAAAMAALIPYGCEPGCFYE